MAMVERQQLLLTAEGKAELEAQLPVLVAKKREIMERIQGTKTYGDMADSGEYSEAKAAPMVTIAGRLVSRRDMGKASFGHLRDGTGDFQLFLRRDALGEEPYARFRGLIDLNDFLEATGTPIVTRTGEPTLEVREYR